MMNAAEGTEQPTEAGYEEVYVHPVCHVQTPENRVSLEARIDH